MLKNTLLYYILIFIPLGLVVNMGRFIADIHIALVFVVVCVYALIYYPTITALRLLHLGVIDKREFWKVYIRPGYYNTKYFFTLFFNYTKK